MGDKYSVHGESRIYAFGYTEFKGGGTRPPCVEISIGEATIELTPEAAREFAAIIVREADKAEQKEEN